MDDEYGNATEFFTWYPPDFGILSGRPWSGRGSQKLWNSCFCITANHRQIDKEYSFSKFPDLKGAYSGEVNSCDEGKYSCFLCLCSTQLLGSRISLGQKSQGSFPSNVPKDSFGRPLESIHMYFRCGTLPRFGRNWNRSLSSSRELR